MKQVFKTNRGILTDEIPCSIPGNKEILVEVKNSLISTGTEIFNMKKQAAPLLEYIREKKKIIDRLRKKLADEGVKPTLEAIRNKLNPSERLLILNPVGYSNAGIIVEKGKEVTNFSIGDRVACAGAGFAAHAEFVAIPINLAVKIPDTLSFEEAAFTTVGAIAMQGIRRANVSFGETVVITGLGLLGQLAVQIAKAWGLIVIGLDPLKERAKLAKSLGADECFISDENDVENKIIQFTSGIGADAVIIYAATQSSDPANQALRICRKRGRVVVVGNVGMNLEREAMYEKELDFVISTSYGPGRYDPEYEIKGNDYPIGYVRWTENRNMQEFVRLLDEKKVITRPLVGEVFPIENAPEAYEHLAGTSKKVISILFSYGSKKKEKETKKFISNRKIVSKGKINVAVIGAGGFSSRFHLANILRLNKYYNLIAVVDKNPVKAKMAGNKFRSQYISTDYHDVLNDKSINMVIIATRHNLHAEMVIDSLQAGKHVLVEKPLAMSYDELQKIREVRKKSNCFLTVGFNRRYSPLSIKAKEIIEKKEGPIFINYRVNAGYIPIANWVQDPIEGGGRIIGECCHFLDLFNYFIEHDIKEIKIASIPVNKKLISSEDNIVVTVVYKNGSIGHLSYVSIGAESMEKERVEIFCGHSSMVINNFNKLEMYETGEKDIKLKKIDKGHLRELEEFAKLINGEKSLILDGEKAFLATEETFEIERKMHG